MSDDDLLLALRRLEEELQQTETLCSTERIESLLHPHFEEFGRSGRRFGRAEVIQQFSAGGEKAAIHSQDYQLAIIGEGLVLLTYRSANVTETGELSRHTLRSSLWMQTDSQWQIRFHQGTPTDEFAKCTT